HSRRLIAALADSSIYEKETSHSHVREEHWCTDLQPPVKLTSTAADLHLDLTQFAEPTFGSGKERQPPSVSLSVRSPRSNSPHTQAFLKPDHAPRPGSRRSTAFPTGRKAPHGRGDKYEIEDARKVRQVSLQRDRLSNFVAL